MSAPPRLDGGHLIVDGRPALLLAGELHNSSSSTGRCMAPRWEGIVDAGCTTVLAPITWEQFEPQEGRFDPTSIEELLVGARTHKLRLVVLWFGSWKNGGSSYVPPWVKADPDRFSTQHLGGAPSSVLSPFVEANAQADATAFAQLMAYLHAHDPDHTVLMVQVENEVGSLGDSRDRSPAAEAAFAGPVPGALLTHLADDTDGCAAEALVKVDASAGPAPTWEQAFGEGQATDEVFMAWHLASYIDRVAAAGRAQHDVPLYVNAWLNADGEGGADNVAGGKQPGMYPSGGPLPHVAAAWHAAAPHIDFLAPDIYSSDPDNWLRRYRNASPAVFVPELHRSHLGLQTIFLAIGAHHAIGTAPFGIDELQDDERVHLRRAYRQLAAIADDILDAQAARTIRGFVARPGERVQLELGAYRLGISPDRRFDGSDQPPDVGYGLVLALGPHEFLTAGHGFILSAQTSDGQPTVLHTVQELDLEPRTGRARDLPVLRWLNGDETLSGLGVRVTGETVTPWPSGIPASPSITGVVRFSLVPAPAG